MGNGNWPHGPNFYQARKARHWAGPGRPPPIGLPAAQLGTAPGTPVNFGGPGVMGYAQLQQGRDQQPPRASLTAVGMPSAPEAGTCEAGSSPPGWGQSVEAMKAHPGISNPLALSRQMRGRGYLPGAGQIGGEFAYVTDPRVVIAPPRPPAAPAGPAYGPTGPAQPSTPEQYTGAPQPSPCIGSPPEACPYIQAGEPPPAPCSGLIQFSSPERAASYQAWWERYYGESPCGPAAAPPPTVVETTGEPVTTPATVTEEPPPASLPPRRPPWGWIVGGTAAAGAIAAGVAYALHRKRKRRRRG